MQDTRLTIGTKSIDDVEHDHIIEVLKALCLAQIMNLIEINTTFLQFIFSGISFSFEWYNLSSFYSWYVAGGLLFISNSYNIPYQQHASWIASL